jgi:hypothetical protein
MDATFFLKQESKAKDDIFNLYEASDSQCARVIFCMAKFPLIFFLKKTYIDFMIYITQFFTFLWQASD